MRNPEKTVGRIIDRAAMRFLAYEEDGGGEVQSFSQVKLTLIKRNGTREIWFSAQLPLTLRKWIQSSPDIHVHFIHKSYLKSAVLSGTIEVREVPETGEDGRYILKLTTVKGRYSTGSRLEHFPING